MPHRAFDDLEVRCPMLGGEVTFRYCRRLDQGLPCRRALVCFAHAFPVETYFRHLLHATTFERCFAPPEQGRYEHLLETFSKARNK